MGGIVAPVAATFAWWFVMRPLIDDTSDDPAPILVVVVVVALGTFLVAGLASFVLVRHRLLAVVVGVAVPLVMWLILFLRWAATYEPR